MRDDIEYETKEMQAVLTAKTNSIRSANDEAAAIRRAIAQAEEDRKYMNDQMFNLEAFQQELDVQQLNLKTKQSAVLV